MSRVRDVRERLHQTQDALVELAKLCAEYAGTDVADSAATYMLKSVRCVTYFQSL